MSHSNKKFKQLIDKFDRASDELTTLYASLHNGTKRQILNSSADVLAAVLELVWDVAEIDYPSEWAFTKVKDAKKLRFTMHLTPNSGKLGPEDLPDGVGGDDDKDDTDASW